MKSAVAFIGAASVILMGAALVTAGRDLPLPDPPAPAEVAEFLSDYVGASAPLIEEWSGFDLRFDEGDRGLVGRWTTVQEFYVGDRTAIEDLNVVRIDDEPQLRLKDVWIEVQRGDQIERFDRKELRWLEWAQRSQGVVMLEGTSSYTVVPGLRVGDRVRVVREHEMKGIHGLGQFVFGGPDTPTLRSGLTIRAPTDYEIVWGALGLESERERVDYQVRAEKRHSVHQWHWSGVGDDEERLCDGDLPVVTIVPHVAHAGDDHAVDISVGRTWREVGQAYLDRIEEVFEPNDELIHEAELIAGEAATAAETIERTYDYVQRQFRYLGLFDAMGGIIPAKAPEVLEAGYGDCKGLGTVLIGLLRARGIEAHPVLVRAGSTGPLHPDIPNMAQFNHYIAWVDDGAGGLFLDGTSDFRPAGVLSMANAASPMLLLRPGSIAMVEAPRESWDIGNLELRVEGQVDDEGMLTLQIAQSVTGNLAVSWRNYFSELESRESERALRAMLLPKQLPMRGSREHIDLENDWNEPARAGLAATTTAAIPSSGTKVFLPKLLPPLPPGLENRPPCAKELSLRGRMPHHEEWRIALPPGLSLVDPDSIGFETKGLHWERRIWQEGDELRLRRDVTWTADTVTPEEFGEIERVVAKAKEAESGYFLLERNVEGR